MNHDHGGLQDYARVAPDSRVAVELLSKVIPMRNSSTLAAPVAPGDATHIWSQLLLFRQLSLHGRRCALLSCPASCGSVCRDSVVAGVCLVLGFDAGVER